MKLKERLAIRDPKTRQSISLVSSVAACGLLLVWDAGFILFGFFGYTWIDQNLGMDLTSGILRAWYIITLIGIATLVATKAWKLVGTWSYPGKK